MSRANRWNVCSVCSRDDVAEINAALAGGATVRSVAVSFGIPRSTVGLHKTRCGVVKAAKPVKAGDGPLPPDGAVKAAQREISGIEARTPEAVALLPIVVDSVALYWESRQSGDTRSAINALPEIRNGLAKLHAINEDAKPPEDSTTAWFRHELLDEMRLVLLGAIADDLTRRAVAGALVAWERARTGEEG